MGFNTVYKYLTEIFPQIDTRLLKAVAIEHSKDADAAANVVLTEILPYCAKQALPVDHSASSSSSKDQSPRKGHLDGDEGDEHEEQSTLRQQLVARKKNKTLSSSSEPGFMTSVYAANTDLAPDHDSDSTSLDKAWKESTVSQLNEANGGCSQLFGNIENEEVILLGKTKEIGVEVEANEVFTAMPDELMNYEGENADVSQVCANTESNDSVLLDEGQDINDKVDHFSQECANTESDYSVSLDKDGDINVKLDHFSQVCANTEGDDSVSLDKGQDINVKVDHFGQICANTESDDLVSLDKGWNIDDKVDPEQTPFFTSSCLVHVNGVADGTLTDGKDFGDSGASFIDTSNCGTSNLVESCLDCPLGNFESSIAQLVPSSVQEHTSDIPECGLQLEIGSGTPSTDCGKPDSSGSYDLMSKQENSMSEKDDIEDESTINTVVTRSGQVCRIDLLEEMIEDAKNNKKTLFIAMESVMNMMKEVEIQEKAAEEVKQEAEKGGLDILMKMEELKLMLAHAKEANDMHAGEIYGEKAILATEARELQNRLLSLSEDRDKSLAILEEMHEALKARLNAAEDMRKEAEQEKLEKEESARNSLAEQEAIMEQVVQESKILQKQAEENSKLQEFLMDRGRVVDSLQGEISVICQDVRLLKEKFDERVPLSKSVSSSQTTCILASSGSSIKSMASLVAEQGLTSDTLEKRSPTQSVDAQSPKSKLEDGITWDELRELSPKNKLENGRTWDDFREFSDDGWDFFDNDTELNCKAL